MSDKKDNRNLERLVWIDLEMTGLNAETDTIIEIATVITDKDLNVLADGPNLIIHQSDTVLANMNQWCIKQHGESGLTQKVRDSSLSMRAAEQQTLDFLTKWVKKSDSPMCGNSICQDRRFLAKHMPELEAFFHYRHIDVSTLKELAKRWNSEVEKDKEAESTHLALNDIYDSIKELQHYREKFISI